MTAPLARDIAWLLERLSEVIPRESGDLMNRVREAAQRMIGAEDIDPVIAGLDPREIHTVLKLLTIQFHLRNKAEQVHIARVNHQRECQSATGKPRPESLNALIHGFAASGQPLERVLELLEGIDIQPTLTAHPTESRRRSIIDKQRRIGDLLQAHDEPDQTPASRLRLESGVRQTLSLLLATDEVRAQRLEVIDEVRNGLHYLAGSIWEAVPTLYRDLEAAIELHYGKRPEIPLLLRYRTWIGGDRDGNPNVTSELTRDALAVMRRVALKRHAETLNALELQLSVSDKRVPIDRALLESIRRDEQDHALDEEELRHLQHEPLRIKLRHMQSKLKSATYSARDFTDDLRTLQSAAKTAGLEEVATRGLLSEAIVRTRTFGFHLAAMDIRQHSAVHERAVADMLHIAGVTDDYAALNEPERLGLLRNELATSRPLLGDAARADEQTIELLDTLRVFAQAAAEEPERVGSYVVSMAHECSDILEVLILLREVGLWRISDDGCECPIDVAPLFETVDDLARAGDVMRNLFAEPAYAAQLQARSRFQEIMLGYSDSSKDGGYWAANWNLDRAQDDLARACAEADISVRLFHGRGGTVARGGGRAHRAILAAPPSSCNGRIRFTEQGEVISFRYAMPEIARRHLEQIVSAVVEAKAHAASNPAPQDDISQLMGDMARDSRAAYRELIDDTEFWPWFVKDSPVLFIGELPIASRPLSRAGKDVEFESLRAIPWVFAWTQMRYNAPGWYGVGAAFEALVLHDDVKLERCRDAYESVGCFRAFIDNAQQEMARARLEVARWYTAGAPAGLRGRLEEEFANAERAILAITGQQALLDNNPVIQQSIRERNPDTDIINALQFALLTKWRSADGNERTELRPLILLSVNALAAAMQSTG